MEPQKKDWLDKSFYFIEDEFPEPTPDEVTKGVTRLIKMMQKKDNVINKYKRDHPGKVKASQFSLIELRGMAMIVETLFYEE